MNDIGENNEYRALRLRVDYLQGRYAEEVEAYMALATVGGEGIRMRYMVALGGLEHMVYEFKIAALRWRRRIELFRAAEARGERPDPLAIEEQVTAELAAYQTKLDEMRALAKEMRAQQAMAVLGEEEVTALRHGYLTAVKKLHPDLNRSLPEGAVALFRKLTKAYSGKDWEELKFLLGLVDGVLKEAVSVPQPTNGIQELKAEIVRLEERLAGMVKKRTDLMKQKPYCWAELLEDEDEVARRREELQVQLEAYKDEIADCEAMWETRKEAA